MNKKELAENIYKKLDIKRFEAYSFIDLLIETIIENLSEGNKIVMSNFGTFKVLLRQKKKVVNPNDKKEMIIPKRKIVKFYPSKNLRELVSNGQK
ncbi:MAG: HU family DNA-binding protein [Acidobacteria bacterium]|jgi:nucleoid DNA-binding protein|nr:HU family DNA-binding protein [Acidobacteriota bacterium]